MTKLKGWRAQRLGRSEMRTELMSVL
jgi:hypothetical protein